MNQKKFIEYCDQVVAEGRKTTIGRVAGLSHEAQPVFTADSPTSSALWHLSLVLREIAENSEPHGDEKQLPRLVPGKDTLTVDQGEYKDGNEWPGQKLQAMKVDTYAD